MLLSPSTHAAKDTSAFSTRPESRFSIGECCTDKQCHITQIEMKPPLLNPISNDAIVAMPLVSIGIPIFNEECFLSQSLMSLLAQDYSNLEFFISDNASTDGTEKICRDIAALDRRIIYERMEHNQGAVTNFRRVLNCAHGKYFMWASGHDLWQPNYVSECVKLLEQEPEAVIAFGSSTWVDSASTLMTRRSGWTDTRGLENVARFHSLLWGNMHPIVGLIRVEALHKTRGFLNTAGADLILLSELTLQGHFVHAVKTSWSRREFRDDEDYRQRMNRYSSSEYGLSRSLISKLTPLLRLPLELVRSVLRAEISMLEKLILLLSFVPILPAKYIVTRNKQTRIKKA